MRIMYDAVDPLYIPLSAPMVAGYVDGRYVWSAEAWARFPHAVKVQIAVLPTTNAGHVLDVEPGNGTPVESVKWVQMRRSAGADPTVYCSHATWQECKQAFLNASVPEPHWWIADWDGKEELPPGAVAKQYQADKYWDLSVVADHWPGVDAPAVVPGTQALKPEPPDDTVTIHRDKLAALLAGVRVLSAHVSDVQDMVSGLDTL